MRGGVAVEAVLDVLKLAGLAARRRPAAAAAAALPCEPRVLLACRELGVSAVTAVTAWRSALCGAWLELAVAPGWASDLPPGRILPENAACSDFCSSWYLDMLTEEIENSTMNSANSSVIMSA